MRHALPGPSISLVPSAIFTRNRLKATFSGWLNLSMRYFSTSSSGAHSPKSPMIASTSSFFFSLSGFYGLSGFPVQAVQAAQAAATLLSGFSRSSCSSGCYDESQQLSSTGSFFFYTSLLFCTRPKGDCMLPVAEVPYPDNDNPGVRQKDTLQAAIRGATTM